MGLDNLRPLGRHGLLWSVALTLLLACTNLTPAEASISLLKSGKTYSSKLDTKLGQPLLRGMDYMGRLQYVAENPTLCPGDYPHQTFDVVTPADGLPSKYQFSNSVLTMDCSLLCMEWIVAFQEPQFIRLEANEFWGDKNQSRIVATALVLTHILFSFLTFILFHFLLPTLYIILLSILQLHWWQRPGDAASWKR